MVLHCTRSLCVEWSDLLNILRKIVKFLSKDSSKMYPTIPSDREIQQIVSRFLRKLMEHVMEDYSSFEDEASPFEKTAKNKRSLGPFRIRKRPNFM